MKKDSNRFITIVILLYVLFLLVQHAYLYVKISSMLSPTTRVSGEVKFCINSPPEIVYNCSLIIYQNDPYDCQVDYYDENNDSVYFNSGFFTSPILFTITPIGVINFTPNQSHIGNHTYAITAMDTSGCDNNLNTDIYTLQVIDVNDPPILIMPIPNQTWNQDTDLQAFDLDSFYYDPDGDPLNYTHTVLSNIQVIISSNNLVTFSPIAGWYGIEYINFIAWDPYMANATSNTVKLEVLQTRFPPTPPSGGGGGSSGGGGGGASFPPPCIPRWYCRPWGPCEPDGLMRRECYDLNNCSTITGRPNITEPCLFVSTCFDGFKGPLEEGIDCGGPCPPCGTCYDNLCNNNEDCLRHLTTQPDCGGPCKECDYLGEGSCYDNVCNNNEDCTRYLTELPDCGGPCEPCPALEKPVLGKAFNWGLLVMLILLAIFTVYVAAKAYPHLIIVAKKRKKKQYEERLLLETRITESIYQSLSKLMALINKEDIQKLLILFSTIVRRYFKELLKLDYEFTYEELIKDVNSRRVSDVFKKVLTKFFERSTELEFSGKSVSKEELRAMISEFMQILSFTSKEPLMVEEQKKQKKKRMGKIDTLFAQISDAENALRKGDLNLAYFDYLRIVHEYNSLELAEKTKLHGFVTRLYEEIKLAREKFEYETKGKI